MKLRIQGNSIRLRLMRSELARLAEGQVVKEEVHLTPAPDGTLSYRLSIREQADPVAVQYAHSALEVSVSPSQFKVWLQESEVGIYVDLPTGSQPLQVSIEKDFACLDRSDAENQDTFAHPEQGTIC